MLTATSNKTMLHKESIMLGRFWDCTFNNQQDNGSFDVSSEMGQFGVFGTLVARSYLANCLSGI